MPNLISFFHLYISNLSQNRPIYMIKLLDDTGQTDYCPPVWDEFLCWPRTRSGEEVTLPCPLGVKGLDPKSMY